jgi:hypothetical protein
MTFARYSRDLWEEEPAKVAKPAKAAKVEAFRRFSLRKFC